MFKHRIVVDGNDGTGKSTLVKRLMALGFQNVCDRGEMTRATDDASVNPSPETTYLLLTCSPLESKSRLISSKSDMSDFYHSDASLVFYHGKFLELVEKFNARVIDTSSISSEIVLHRALELLGVHVHVGLPTGRLSRFGDEFGYPFNLTLNSTRTLVERIGSITLVRNRTKTYPQMISFDDLDVAVVGSDALESNVFSDNCRIISRISQTGVRVAIAGKQNNLRPVKKQFLRVATPFPSWARRVFGELGIPHTIYEVSGGSESLVAHGVADVVFDIVESGETIRANSLHIIEELGTLDAVLIGRKI